MDSKPPTAFHENVTTNARFDWRDFVKRQFFPRTKINKNFRGMLPVASSLLIQILFLHNPLPTSGPSRHCPYATWYRERGETGGSQDLADITAPSRSWLSQQYPLTDTLTTQHPGKLGTRFQSPFSLGIENLCFHEIRIFLENPVKSDFYDNHERFTT